jgi:predicted acylesterase/phospholipase RssA
LIKRRAKVAQQIDHSQEDVMDTVLRDCDLVMKGGVTSGLVYPGAVVGLSKEYRLRSIGGTSAGAVAAGLAAAAEYSRSDGGFERLQEVADKLKEPGFLKGLFQAEPNTRPLLNAVVQARELGDSLQKATRGKGLAWMVSVARWALAALKAIEVEGLHKGGRYGAFAGLIAAALVIALIWVIGLATTLPSVPLLVLSLIACALVFGAIGWILGTLVFGAKRLLDIILVDVPRNRFGICSGRGTPDHPGVTDWLQQSIEYIRNCKNTDASSLLTMGELQGRKINLQFVSTDVSDGRPYVLPLEELFLFKPADFKELFSEEVVDHLCEHARDVAGIQLPSEGSAEYLFLPAPANWPVVVAARLSMSFPFFFSSAPLYRLPRIVENAVQSSRDDKTGIVTYGIAPQALSELRKDLDITVPEHALRLRPEHLIVHWFSDGGIASNFPIHFFDSWFPRHPTFGITLRYVPVDLPDNATEQQRREAESYLYSQGERKAECKHLIGERKANQKARHPTNGNDTPGDDDLAQNGIRADVSLPSGVGQVPPEWQPIHDPSESPGNTAASRFLWAVIKTMQNYRDNMQAALPGCSDRVVQIRLRPDEGGFNLNMDNDIITAVSARGKVASDQLLDKFSMAHHRWIRLRMLVSRLEDAFEVLNSKDVGKVIRRGINDQAFPGSHYPAARRNPQWCRELNSRMQKLLDLTAGPWKKRSEIFKSASTLRVTPHP